MSLGELLDQRRLLVCVGPGGVGKTTLSAAMGVAAATRGRNVLVLTIDPARRLADALGVDGLQDDAHHVPIPGAQGTMHAAMVEAGPSYDRLLATLTPDASLLRRLRENPIYQAFSRSLARSHAYVAMERLHDAMADDRWDLVILDTPPARNAVEILDAPGRLATFLEHSVVRWLLPGQGRAGRGRFIHGGRAARAILRGLLGKRLLGEATEFFGLFGRLRHVFATRAGRVERLLRSPESAFVLVADPTPGTLSAAAALDEDLRARGISVSAAILNRCYEILDTADPTAVITEVDEALPRGLPDALADVARRLRTLRARAAADNAASTGAVSELTVQLPVSTPRVAIPRLDHAGHSVEGLGALAPFFSSTSDDL